MGHQQDMSAAIAFQQGVPGHADALIERPNRLAVRNGMGDRVAPEPAQRRRVFVMHFGHAASFPHSEADFAEAMGDLQRPVQPLRQGLGEGGTADQGRTDDGLPVLVSSDSRLHLFPTAWTERIVHRSAEFLASIRLAMPQQIYDGEVVHC